MSLCHAFTRLWLCALTLLVAVSYATETTNVQHELPPPPTPWLILASRGSSAHFYGNTFLNGNLLHMGARVVCVDCKELLLSDMTFHLPPNFHGPLFYVHNAGTFRLRNVVVYLNGFKDVDKLIHHSHDNKHTCGVMDVSGLRVYNSQADDPWFIRDNFGWLMCAAVLIFSIVRLFQRL